MACLHECQVAIMRAYEVASMHRSKPCYINMSLTIDEPFWFNASLRHILVNLALVVNTLSNSSYSLSFLSYLLLLILLFILKLVPSFDPDINTHVLKHVAIIDPLGAMLKRTMLMSQKRGCTCILLFLSQ